MGRENEWKIAVVGELGTLQLIHVRRAPHNTRRRAPMAALTQAILAVLVEGGVKPNKLRKTVMARQTVQDEGASWDDFAASLAALEASGTVERETQADFSELCVLVGASVQKKKKRALDALAEATPAQGEAGKKAKRPKEQPVKGSDDGAAAPKTIIRTTMTVPARFVPFLLRQSGKKVKNIEVNTKTHIQCGSKEEAAAPSSRASKAPGTQLPSGALERLAADRAVGDKEEKDKDRVLTITGGEAKHLKGAQILIEKMLEAFQRNGKPGGDSNGGKGKGGGGKGKGKGKGGKGKGGTGRAALPETDHGDSEGGDAKKKRRDRKFY